METMLFTEMGLYYKKTGNKGVYLGGKVMLGPKQRVYIGLQIVPDSQEFYWHHPDEVVKVAEIL